MKVEAALWIAASFFVAGLAVRSLIEDTYYRQNIPAIGDGMAAALFVLVGMIAINEGTK